ncbi:MAG: hypothetical protein IKY35_05125 [Muribaculaceae bacterium]|nr:hypothetical protein [Muribaculaceae bacterium]
MPELKWGFPTQTKDNHFDGLNNAGIQSYNDHIPSIIREAIQNSLDAAISPQGEVGVSIAYGILKRDVLEEVFNAILSIKDHVELCKKEYHDLGNHQNEVRYFQKMLDKIGHFEKLGCIPFLKIKDTGTIGMYHNAANPRSGRLCTFIQSDGVNNADNQRGGGANGIGKMAYYAMSPLSMVLVSTCAIENSGTNKSLAKTFFSGSTRLTTHSNPNNEQEQYQKAGYLPAIPAGSVFEPLCGDDIDEQLPFALNRRPNKDADPELGTTIYIIGCEPDGLDDINDPRGYEEQFRSKSQKIYATMAEAVLRNYWLAIHRGRLKIELGTTTREQSCMTIDNNNIIQQLENRFQDERFGRQQRNYNPLHFAKALTTDDDNIRYYELDLDNKLPQLSGNKKWGKVRLYINIDDALQGNMIICMRSPLMMVDRYQIDTNAGSYAGVLVCDEEGNYCNELLRLSEPHTHDKWEPGQVRQRVGTYQEAKHLLDEIKQWVTRIINELFVNENANTGRFLGMSEILPFYNPEDASLRDSNLNKGDAMSGETSTIEIRERRRKESKGTKVSNIHQSPAEPTTDDEPTATGGGGTTGKGGNAPGYTDPNRSVKVNPDGHQTSIVEEVDLKVRYFAQKENDGTWKYIIILQGNKDYENIALRFEEQKENTSSDKNYLQVRRIGEGRVHTKDNTKVHSISLEANNPKRIEVVFKMDTRRIALKVTSTLNKEVETE